MKRITKAFAVLLAFALMIPLFSITGFGAVTVDQTLTHYINGKGYLAFGDSVSRGYGLQTFWDHGYKMDNPPGDGVDEYYGSKKCRVVEGSFPYLIAQTLNCNAPWDMTDKSATYWPIAQDGLTTSFILDLLGVEDNYCDRDFIYDLCNSAGQYYIKNRYRADLYYFGDPESVAEDGNGKYGNTGLSYSVRDLVSGSSLITIELGMGDILNRSRSIVFDSFLAENGDLSDIQAVITVIKNFISVAYEGYKRWEQSFPMILDYFKENTNATVVIIGAYNPIYGLTVTEDIPVPVGTAMTALTNLMNQKYRMWAQEYGYTFVDISNVDTGSSENPIGIIDFLTSAANVQGKLTHPTKEGYQQIARMVLNALREKDAVVKTEKTTIQVDLGALGANEVNYVSVDGTKLETEEYSVSDHVLSIPYGSSSAGRLTVGAANDEKAPIALYRLSFDEVDGYIPLRLYNSSDISPIKDKITDAINSVKAVIAKIPGLKTQS